MSNATRPTKTHTGNEPGIREAYALLSTFSLSPRLVLNGDMTERATAIRGIIRILGRYGIDGDSAFRYGFAYESALPVLRSILTPDHKDSLPEQLAIRWQRTFDAHVTPNALDMWVGRFLNWFRNAPMDQLLELQAPDREQWDKLPSFSPMDEDIASPYIWLRDRYLFPTHPEAWNTASLHHEYRYMESGDLNGFSERAILPATLEPNTLNAHIARRAAHSKQDEARRLYENIYYYAIPLLKRGGTATAQRNYSNSIWPSTLMTDRRVSPTRSASYPSIRKMPNGS